VFLDVSIFLNEGSEDAFTPANWSVLDIISILVNYYKVFLDIYLLKNTMIVIFKYMLESKIIINEENINIAN